ncbi:MAG: Hpt domain-containing protein [Eggerthellaceae bacterium]|nr:Hpt domain-containing protein [Eggerthellaceae bacterium]
MAEDMNTKLAPYGIDYLDAMDRMDNDRDLYKMLALKYLDNSKYTDLVAALEVEDFDEAYKAAHSLKGVAGNLSFSKLFDVAASMSEALFQGEYQAAEKMLPDLSDANDKVIEGLNAWKDGSL